jgi:hypothetical protein
MAHPKSQLQTYNTDWGKVKAWAAQQKIPTTAVANVQALDTSRLQSGYYPMSDAERTRAILAAAGMNYSTALPTDNPSPSDVVGNTIRNVQGIATGLMPSRLVSNIWGTLKNTVKDIEHPAQAGGLGKILEDTAVSWLPGAYDLGQVIQAHGLVKGLEDLASQPLTSILDVMPFLSAGDAAIGAMAATGSVEDAATAAITRTAPRIAKKLNVPDISANATTLSKTLAKRTGMGELGVAKLGAVRMAGKAVGSVTIGKTPEAYMAPVAGKEAVRVPTLSERASNIATNIGVGKTLSRAAHTLGTVTNQATSHYRNLTKTYHEKVAALTPEERDAQGNVIRPSEQDQFAKVMTDLGDGKLDPIAVIDDSDLPVHVREAVQAYQQWEDWHKKWMIGAGKGFTMPIREADGTVTESLFGATEFGQLAPFRRAAEKAQAEADRLSAGVDDATTKMNGMNDVFTPIRNDLFRTKQALIDTMGVTRSYVRKTFTDLLGSVIGKDGLLDQMDSAYRAKNFALYTKLAKQARRRMDSPKFASDVSPNIVHLKGALDHAVAQGQTMADLERQLMRAYTPKVHEANREANRTQATLLREATRRAPEYRNLIVHTYYDKLLASDKAEAILEAGANKLVKEKGWAQDAADKLRRENSQRLFEIVAVEADSLFHDPFLPQMTPGDHAHFMNDALKEVTSLRARGHPPMWMPTVTADQAETLARQGDRVYVSPTRFPTVRSAFSKAMDMSRTVNDVSIGVDRATKEAMSWDASIEFTRESIVPMLKPRTGLRDTILREGAEPFMGTTGARGVVDAKINNEFGLSRFNVKPLLDEKGNLLEESDLAKATGLNAEDMGLDPEETYYIPTAFKKHLDGLVGDQFPGKGAWDASTRVFKYSILGLSPRYTAHIVFGGGMLLALRIDPRAFLFIKDAAKMVSQYHKGTLQDQRLSDIFQGATQRGTPEQTFHTAAGDKAFRLNVEEWLTRHHINPKYAKGVDIAKAGADINFRFTNYISDMQKSIAYLDGMHKAKGKAYFDDPITGERTEATDDQLHFQAMQAAERVMGNLQAMTPLERSIARKIMPFYGWTKHILKYVLTFPTDHPWRVMFLSTLATQNTDNFASGLDERMQLLLFLGQPDTSGNVSAVDIRAMDPFRDVANYATLGGWLSAMNPILTAPITAIDPSIIYGGNTLYPNVTYSQLYGTNVAQPQGGILTAAEQEIPEIGALDQALGLSANARAVKKQGGTAALKDTLSSLGFPWTVQKLNLQQISAKHELDRYNQAKTDAGTAWQTGDFSALDKYPGTVPDPLGTGYNITPKQLEEEYQRALKAYPGLPPSETIPNLPTAPL